MRLKKRCPDCDWWCQTGVGFPRLGAPGTNRLYGMRWHCPDCGRSWVVKGDDWYQEYRLEAWFKDHPRAWWRGTWDRIRRRWGGNDESPRH